jgi:predicted amidophosphoribosyltransferase
MECCESSVRDLQRMEYICPSCVLALEEYYVDLMVDSLREDLDDNN